MGEKKSPASILVADQLIALMERHAIPNAQEWSRRLDKRQTPVNYTTIDRIRKAEAKTRPEEATLRILAESVGETYDEAFLGCRIRKDASAQ